MEILKLVRAEWPADKPLFVRISATEWDERGEKDQDGNWSSWGLEQSQILTKHLVDMGVDVLDVSTGGNYVNQKIELKPGYQVSDVFNVTALSNLNASLTGRLRSGH